MIETRTSETAASGVVELLEQQHRRMDVLFDATLETEGRERRDNFHRLILLLATHETAEEKVIHPAVRRLDAGIARSVDARHAEEEEIKTSIERLEHMGPNHREFITELTALRDQIEHHVGAEEREGFALMRDRLGNETSRRLLRRVQHAEAVVAAHHPGYSLTENGPDVSAGDILLAPFRFLADLVADALNEAEDRAHPGDQPS